jgi:site-specific DNA-cytosine methylase
MSRSSDGYRPQLGEVARLLPTPDANMGNGGRRRSAGSLARGDHQANLIPRLLPTPTAQDSAGSRRATARTDEWTSHPGTTLTDAVLLPTPNASDHIEKRTTHAGGNLTLQGATSGVNPTDAARLAVKDVAEWGDYAPAIERWSAIVGRPAPPPTELGPHGSPRLSPRFVEWMMGLPDGWVTDVPGLARTSQLKALGNGVLPLQAAAALEWLLTIGAAA